MTKTITIINGPNLNLLGQRQPEIYGAETLQTVGVACANIAQSAGHKVEMLQSNSEGALVDMIQKCRDGSAGIIINAGAYSHTSIAILDALNTFDGPVLEVHVSNIYKREAFRHHSHISARADGVMAGFGAQGYELAVQRMIHLLA